MKNQIENWTNPNVYDNDDVEKKAKKSDNVRWKEWEWVNEWSGHSHDIQIHKRGITLISTKMSQAQ